MIRRLLFVAALALAVGFLAAGGRIWLKAQLAQYLLRRAWAATDAGAGRSSRGRGPTRGRWRGWSRRGTTSI